MFLSRDKLFSCSDIYNYNTENKNLFLSAMQEVIEYHSINNAFYLKLLKENQFSVNNINSEENIKDIPVIPANFFKTHTVNTVKDTDILSKRTSSGTTGQKSEFCFDEWTSVSAFKMIVNTLGYFDFIDSTPTNYLLYSYEIDKNSNLGTANTNIMLTFFAPAKNKFFALPKNGNSNDFDIFGSIRALRAFSKANAPVRILGFPAFLYETLLFMENNNNEKLTMHPDSLVILGGGWKNYNNKKIPKEQLYDMIQNRLGIKKERCRNIYAAVEHPVPYIECEKHNFHVPIFSRVLIRDPKTLEVLPFGKVGLLNFVSPHMTSVPANSVLMSDFAVLHESHKCGCSIKSPFFEVIGRSGINKNKNCSISSLELLRRN